MRTNKSSGFTLVEVIITIVLVGLFLSAGISLFVNSGKSSVNVEKFLIGQSLAEERLELKMARNYSTLTNEAQTNFTGDFALFSYQTSVDYVTSANLDTASASDTGYKRIRVQIRHPSYSGNFIQLESIKANF